VLEAERGSEAWTLRLLGDIAAHHEPPEAESANDYYRQALTLAEELGMRPLQAHCYQGLGTLYATLGRRELAHSELATAIRLYRAMEMTFWLPQAEAALAQVVLLSGEAGIGKSRLVQVLTAHVATEPQAWLTPCQCSPYYQHTALYPLIELLERVALRFEQEESPVQQLRKVEGFVAQHGLPL
jgi:predicted ATPase